MKKLVICVFTVEHTDMTLNVNARGSVKRHQTENSAFFVCFIFIKAITTSIFLRYLQIKSSLVLIVITLKLNLSYKLNLKLKEKITQTTH